LPDSRRNAALFLALNHAKRLERSGIMNTKHLFVSGLVLTALALSACASDGRYSERRHLDDMPTRTYDAHPSHFDSDVYYDPTYNLRNDGEFRPRYKLKPNN
jgi:hypothetical protein